MNDGVTRALLNAGVLSSGNAPQAQIKLLEIPAALQKQSVITGEVVANKDGKITLNTPQGNVVFEADVALQVGQKIALKLQIITQNAQQNIFIELSSVTGGSGNTKAPSVVNVPPTTTQAVPQNITMSDLMRDYAVALDERFQALPSIDSKMVRLPNAMPQEAVNLLMKEILNLPVGQSLPPPLQEGLRQIQSLLPMLERFMGLLPMADSAQGANQLTSQVTNQDALKAIMQFLHQLQQPNASAQATSPIVTGWTPQSMALVQTLMPGQVVTPEIVQHLRQAFETLQAQAPHTTQAGIASAPAPAQVTPEMLNAIQPSIASNDKAVIPIVSLVLGQKNIAQATNTMTPQTIMLSFMPQGDKIMMFVMPSGDNQKPLLPGSVLISAMPQASAQNIPSLPIAQILTGMAQAEQPGLQGLQLALGGNWPALEEIWQSLLEQSPLHHDALSAMTTMRHAIPAPTAQIMTPAVLFFMAALKLATPDQWLGEKTMQALRAQGKADVINQLTRDMQAIRASLFDSTPSEAWRPLPIPLQLGDELTRLQWFYRHQYDDASGGSSGNDADPKKRKTRFIVDVPQTRLGDIQIDGLMQERNLDLILRTESAMALYMESAIRDRYQKALELSSIQGSISFQNGRSQYVKP